MIRTEKFKDGLRCDYRYGFRTQRTLYLDYSREYNWSQLQCYTLTTITAFVLMFPPNATCRSLSGWGTRFLPHLTLAQSLCWPCQILKLHCSLRPFFLPLSLFTSFSPFLPSLSPAQRSDLNCLFSFSSSSLHRSFPVFPHRYFSQ